MGEQIGKDSCSPFPVQTLFLVRVLDSVYSVTYFYWGIPLSATDKCTDWQGQQFMLNLANNFYLSSQG